MKSMRLTRVTAIALITIGCFALPAFAGKVDEELAAMNSQIATLSKTWQSQFDASDKRMKKLEENIVTIMRNQAEVISRMDSVTGKLSESDGKVDIAQNDIKTLVQQVISLNNQINLIAKKIVGEEVVAEQKASDPEEVFKQAFQDFQKQKWDMAITGFRDYLNSSTPGPRAAEAQFNVGEALYSQGKFMESLVEFRKVLTNYPKSEKAPDALLKIGIAQQSLGNKGDAKDVFHEVMRTFPDSSHSRLAQERLKQLEK